MRLFVFNHTLCHHKRLESQFKSFQGKNGKTFSQSCNVQKKWKNFFCKAVMCRQNEKTFYLKSGSQTCEKWPTIKNKTIKKVCGIGLPKINSGSR